MVTGTLKVNAREVERICDRAISEIAAGDNEALSLIWDALGKMIYAVVFSITSQTADAEDAMQETMLDIIRYSRSYRAGSYARAWILTIARHRAMDIVRARRHFSDTDDETLDLIADTDEDMQKQWQETEEILSPLTDDDKQIVLFKVFSELSFREISKIMDLSVFAVQKRYQRAITQLRCSLETQKTGNKPLHKSTYEGRKKG